MPRPPYSSGTIQPSSLARSRPRSRCHLGGASRVRMGAGLSGGEGIWEPWMRSVLMKVVWSASGRWPMPDVDSLIAFGRHSAGMVPAGRCGHRWQGKEWP
jgi:hypothetical protein